jgi:folate-binding protein YgfZ
LLPIAGAAEWLASVLNSDPECDLVGTEAVDAMRIAEGLPRPGNDFGPENFPQEAALGDHISYTKGCYIGQEPHARMFHRGHPNWQLVGLRIPESVKAAAGAPLLHDGNEIGRLTSVSLITQDGMRAALGWVRHAIAEAQNPVTLESGRVELTPFPLPNTIRRTVPETKSS